MNKWFFDNAGNMKTLYYVINRSRGTGITIMIPSNNFPALHVTGSLSINYIDNKTKPVEGLNNAGFLQGLFILLFSEFTSPKNIDYIIITREFEYIDDVLEDE